MDWTNLSLAQILAIFKSHFLDQAETSTAFAPPLRSRCAGHSGSRSSTKRTPEEDGFFTHGWREAHEP
jgi:hypothetical protein